MHRAIAILKLLANSDPMTVSEIARAIQTPKTTCFMILQTLEKEEMVCRTIDNKYKTGQGIFDFVFGNDFVGLLRRAGEPILQEFAAAEEKTVHLAVRQGLETIYVVKAESQGFVQFNTHVGQRHMLHLTSVGKSILMGMDDEEILQLIPREQFQLKTDFTITSPEKLLEQIREFRNKGYATEDEEGEYGIRCVGVPVVDSKGRTLAAISVTELKSKLPDSKYDEVGRMLAETAAKLVRSLEMSRFQS